MLSLGDWEGGGVIRSKEGKGGTSRAQRGTLPEEKALGLESEDPGSHSGFCLSHW